MNSAENFVGGSSSIGLTESLPERTPRPVGAKCALAGVRVVDFTHFIAGPFATMILADMGADVVKVEAPGRGDEFRYYPPVHPELPRQGVPYLWANRNKQSIAVDLKADRGRDIVHRLIADADVIVENFSSGVMDRLGLGYAICKKSNPRIIYCSVSAYGRQGAFSDRLGFDPVAQAESGFISMNGFPDREGVRTLSPVIDISTAMMAANAILGALYARTHTGEGQEVDVALYDSAVLMTGYAPMRYLFTGKETRRHGNISPDTAPAGVFHSSDKPFYINCGNDKIFQRLMVQVVERPDLAKDPAYSHRDARMHAHEQLLQTLNEIFGKQPWSYWQARMRAAAIPCGDVRTVSEAVHSAESRERAVIAKVPHPKLGWLADMALPIRYSGTPLRDPSPAPALGSHTESLLRDRLGYSAETIAELRSAGIVDVE